MNRLIGLIQLRVDVFCYLIEFILPGNAFGDQLVCVNLMQRWSLTDTIIHLGLCEIGLIAFIMPIAAVADQINHDIFSKLPAVVGRQLNNMHNSLRVFTMHVKNGYHQHLGNIGGVSRGARMFRKGGVTDLIVDNDMNRTAGLVSIQLRHIQCFSHDTLAGKSGVAMYQ